MNVFQMTFDLRLQSWFQLRQSLINSTTQEKCIAIDNWWQQAPTVNHYLHPYEMGNWPNPWELLSENNYCTYARGLGIIYTLLLLGINDIDLVDATDDNSEDVVLVLVDNAKYILNYWPNTVISNKLKDFKVVKKIDLTKIKTKIGKI